MKKKRTSSFYPAFDTLCNCSDTLRQRILREFSAMDLALALMGAGDAVTEYLLELLTDTERSTLEAQRPCFPRRIDVAAAQKNILKQIEIWEEE